jgi:hypothetical protein
MAAATEKPIAFEAQKGKAPCQDVVIDKPDLGKLPIPTHSPLDAGAFITAGVVIARDPENGRHNLSYNRMQIYGADKSGISMNIWRHIKAFFDKIEPQGKNLPFCVALGPDPVVMMAAAFRYAGDEYEVAGSLRQQPIPVVRAKFLSPEDRAAYALADNKLAELSPWKDDVLAKELNALVAKNYDLGVTGFSLANLDFSLPGDKIAEEAESVELPDPAARAVSRVRDINPPSVRNAPHPRDRRGTGISCTAPLLNPFRR